MLSCKELVARSSDFLDGQLDFRGQLAVRSHLLMCRHCRRFIRQMRLTQATVRHLPERQGPELDRLAAHLSELRKDAARR
ncbi:anti-sigma factor family protein [Pseudomonas aeruginosa]|uniref:anti-sigma factor family protein n=1 Tax=Pseudomonas aeruginosa TaxID=287 RepID=UPI000FED1F93|nr:zf-HC2 domain-containing protein [Pseudomonas aeruginosa]RWX87359.1 zf-HC2 domain-containing protein [Pseudomonas aeruginosa]HJE37923.1 zf-HC2 domain-containing protein [Pseudomonas aeruginosa]